MALNVAGRRSQSSEYPDLGPKQSASRVAIIVRESRKPVRPVVQGDVAPSIVNVHSRHQQRSLLVNQPHADSLDAPLAFDQIRKQEVATCKPGYGRQFDSADESLRPKQLECGRTLDLSVVNIDHTYELVEEDFASASLKASARRQVIRRQPATLLRRLISARGAQARSKVGESVGAPFR